MRWIAWVVAAIAALAMGQAPATDNPYIMSDGRACSAKGDNPRLELVTLDLQKNRATAPTAGEIDPDVTLAAILSPGTDIGRFDPTRGATVEGIVIRVKQGSKESCNCHAQNAVDQDTHIELALSSGATRTQR